MSEYINNREVRKNTIKDIIRQLHEGKSVEEVKAQFEDVFEGVSASEISEAEAALIMEGVDLGEIQSLCDVHASVFKGSIEEIHQEVDEMDPRKVSGHPINIMLQENRAIEELITKEIRPSLEALDKPENYEKLIEGIKKLAKIDLHYSRKENLLFPYIEKYGVTAPPKVMWGVDDEIRAYIKANQALLTKSLAANADIIKSIEDMLGKVDEMIFKEENILFPMLLEKLTQDEWQAIADESGEIGFLIEQVPAWKARLNEAPVNEAIQSQEDGLVKLPTGVLSLEELECMLNTLPFDITFVNKDDVVRYFSESSERIFVRTKAIVGRTVSNCHPPASVHVVDQIVEDFKSGKKDHEDFWLHMGDAYIFIRYFAVHNTKGEYIGVLEVTQDIKEIQQIVGEKRLASE